MASDVVGGLSGSVSTSALDALPLRRATSTFIRTEYRDTYPFRNALDAKHQLKAKVYPTNEFLRAASTDTMNMPLLHDLRIHHSFLIRARTAKKLEEQNPMDTKKQQNRSR